MERQQLHSIRDDRRRQLHGADQTSNIPGLSNNNATVARNILYNLAGSIDNIRQAFDLKSAEGPLQFMGYQDGVKLKSRDWRANEFSAFFKDDWKVTPNLSLNLGINWEWYGVPYEGSGLAGRVVTDKGALRHRLRRSDNGGIRRKKLSDPDKQLFNDEWNNFAPAIGFSYSIPGLGRQHGSARRLRRQLLGREDQGRHGRRWTGRGRRHAAGSGRKRGGNGLTYTQAGYWNLGKTHVVLHASVPAAERSSVDRSADSHHEHVRTERVSPYIQNFNLSIQRELARNLILDVAYVGSKGTKLYGGLTNNYTRLPTQFLEAFKVTRAGGNQPLFDRMLMGSTSPAPES